MKVHNSVGAVESLEEVCLDVLFHFFLCFSMFFQQLKKAAYSTG